ncbi:hypothetical protein Dimus_028252 [Dionaea muscipula]
MNLLAQFGRRVLWKIPHQCGSVRRFCDQGLYDDDVGNGFMPIEELLKESAEFLDVPADVDDQETQFQGSSSTRQFFVGSALRDADRVFEVLRQDGPGFDVRSALSELNIRVSGILVREVLLKLRRMIDIRNKNRCARLGYKFFLWSGQHENYMHTANAYHLMLKILADTGEIVPMWRLVDEMTDKGYPTTARAFNILIRACAEKGLGRQTVVRFIKSKTFNFRPFKHSYNAILHSLVSINEYKLIEWVHQRMLDDGYSPDILTYNILMCAKYRLGKLYQFHRLLDEMGKNGFSPDVHTYNLLLHVLGRGDKPLAALNLLNHMKEVGIYPSVLHFTTLIDGLSRAGNLDACKYFFDEMITNGCNPDVVSYTVMITAYVVAGELDKSRQLFNEMIAEGKLPNAYTYNSMIRGLCMERKFKEACSMLKEMEYRGCTPNFLVYSTLVNNLRSAGKVSAAGEVLSYMLEKGHYVHLQSKFKGYRRS